MHFSLSTLVSLWLVKPQRARRRVRAVAPEVLERRVVPAELLWTGAVSQFWSNPANWQGNVVPAAGDSLVFSNSNRKTTVNDLATGTFFSSIQVTQADYVLTGNGIDVDTISFSATAGQSRIDMNVDLQGSDLASLIQVNGGRLVLGGVLSGDATRPLTKAGSGILRYEGSSANTYAGLTQIGNGRLELNKTSSAIDDAIRGDLVMGGTAPVQVVLMQSHQIANTSRITIAGGAVLRFDATVALANRNETLGQVSFTDGTIDFSGGQLFLVGNVGSESGTLRADRVSLGGTRSFLVTGSLVIDAEIGNGSLRKTGDGTLEFVGSRANTYTGTTDVLRGTLILNKNDNVTAIASGAIFVDNAVLQVEAHNAINPASFVPLTVSTGGVFRSNNHVTTIGALTLTGGQVVGGTSVPLDISRMIDERTPGAAVAESGESTLSGLFRMPNIWTLTAKRGAQVTFDDTFQVNYSQFLTPDRFIVKSGAGVVVHETDFQTFNGLNVNGGTYIYNGPNTHMDVLIGVGRFETLPGTQIQIGDVVNGTLVTYSPGGRTGFGTLEVGEFRPDGVFEVNVDRDFTEKIVVNAVLGPFIVGGILDLRVGVAHVNDAFTILENRGTNATIGTFALPDGNQLEEGEVFTAGGVQFRINYTAGAGNNDIVVTRVNSAPAFQNRAVTPKKVEEGALVTLSGTITEPDAGDTFFLDIDWGDGTPLETITVLPGESRDVTATHRYRADGKYTIRLLWRDQHGGFNTGELKVKVKNARPGFLSLDDDHSPSEDDLASGFPVGKRPRK